MTRRAALGAGDEGRRMEEIHGPGLSLPLGRVFGGRGCTKAGKAALLAETAGSLYPICFRVSGFQPTRFDISAAVCITR